MFQPEIVSGDPLYELIVELVVKYKPKTILEIGSGNGLGSTRAFIKGITDAKIDNECKLFCIEPDSQRWKDLAINSRFYKFIHCILGCSSPVNNYMSYHDIEKFMKEHGYSFNIKRHSVDTVKKWKRDEIEMIEKFDVDSEHILINQGAYCEAVLAAIGRKNIIEGYEEFKAFRFDMVLIDGSAFCGSTDYDLCYGSKVIIMDDTLDIKCHEAMCRAICDPMYKLIHENKTYRNGFAVFERVEECA